MEMHLDIALQNLHCITPTDPSGKDEPYVWIFFIVADGSTIRQRLDDPLRLSASITVQSGVGRPGNLGEAKAFSSKDIKIPEPIGRYESSIKSIALNLPFGTPPMKVFIPGRMVTMCAAIDEEAVPRDAMEAAFKAVKVHIENSLNDFFNGLSMTDFTSALNDPTDPIGAASSLFDKKLDTVISKISDEAEDIADKTAMAWVIRDVDGFWDVGGWAQLAAAAADKDEPIGSHTFTIDEVGIIEESLHKHLHADLRQAHIGLSGAWYKVSGYSNASMRFVPGDHKISQLPDQVAVMGATELKKVQIGRKCVEQGTVVAVQRSAHTQQWQVVVNYPFMGYRYFLEGQEMVGDGGTLRISKVVSFPQFDENKFYFIGATSETRHVTITYERLSIPGVPQLHRILITNQPADGNFDLHLTIVGVLPSGVFVPVADEGLAIVGQSIDFPDRFRQGYIACIASILDEKWIRVKKTIPDRWRTPEVAWNQYKEVVNQLATLKSLQMYNVHTVEMIEQEIARKLKLEVSEDQVEKEMPPEEDEHRGKAALTELFNEVKTADTPIIVERVVNDIDEIVRLVRFPGWQGTQAGEREVKKALRKALFKYKLHAEEELFEKAYNYIRQYY